MRNINNDLLVLIPVIVGLLLLTLDLLLKQKIQKADLEFRKKQFDEEKEYREEQKKWLEENTVNLSKVSNILSQNIVQDLKKDITWATETLEKAKIGLQSRTLFGERMEHFRDEKEFIAEQFSSKLIDRCKYLVEQDKHVYIIIDSGTTLYPLFKKLGEESVHAHEFKEKWISHVTLVTNNLVGVEALMEKGRLNPGNRFSPLAIDCELLPGKPLPIYLAVTGERTEKALNDLSEEKKRENSFFIGITTGNWIRLRRTDPACPVPLARGFGHLSFKQVLIDISDETYVISPLGKIFVKNSLSDVNLALGFEHDKKYQELQEYSEVNINNEKAKTVYLVSTCRFQGKVLSTLSTIVKSTLELDDGDFEDSSSNYVPRHYLFLFNKLNDHWHFQIEQEFPHAKTRKPEFYKKYFFVEEGPLNSLKASIGK